MRKGEDRKGGWEGKGGLERARKGKGRVRECKKGWVRPRRARICEEG